MLEKFKIFFNTLSVEDRKKAIKYIIETQNITFLNEGLYTGPSNSKGKCKVCGK